MATTMADDDNIIDDSSSHDGKLSNMVDLAVKANNGLVTQL